MLRERSISGPLDTVTLYFPGGVGIENEALVLARMVETVKSMDFIAVVEGAIVVECGTRILLLGGDSQTIYS